MGYCLEFPWSVIVFGSVQQRPRGGVQQDKHPCSKRKSCWWHNVMTIVMEQIETAFFPLNTLCPLGVFKTALTTPRDGIVCQLLACKGQSLYKTGTTWKMPFVPSTFAPCSGLARAGSSFGLVSLGRRIAVRLARKPQNCSTSPNHF